METPWRRQAVLLVAKHLTTNNLLSSSDLRFRFFIAASVIMNGQVWRMQSIVVQNVLQKIFHKTPMFWTLGLVPLFGRFQHLDGEMATLRWINCLKAMI